MSSEKIENQLLNKLFDLQVLKDLADDDDETQWSLRMHTQIPSAFVAQFLTFINHLSIIKCLEPLANHPENIPHEPWEQPPQCMPDEYKDKCSVKAYWNYYIGEKHTVANPKTEKIYEAL